MKTKTILNATPAALRDLTNQVDQHPHAQLGRNGSSFATEDRLGVVAERLDALMVLISGGSPDTDFHSLTDHAKEALIFLAGDLAREVHELVDSMGAERLGQFRGRQI